MPFIGLAYVTPSRRLTLLLPFPISYWVLLGQPQRNQQQQRQRQVCCLRNRRCHGSLPHTLLYLWCAQTNLLLLFLLFCCYCCHESHFKSPLPHLPPTPPALTLSLPGRFCVAELLIFIRVSNYIGSPATVSVQLLRLLWACSFNGADSYDFVSSPLKAAPCMPCLLASRWANVASFELAIFNLIKKSRRPPSSSSLSSWPQCNCTASILIKVSTRIHLLRCALEALDKQGVRQRQQR